VGPAGGHAGDGQGEVGKKIQRRSVQELQGKEKGGEKEREKRNRGTLTPWEAATAYTFGRVRGGKKNETRSIGKMEAGEEGKGISRTGAWGCQC